LLATDHGAGLVAGQVGGDSEHERARVLHPATLSSTLLREHAHERFLRKLLRPLGVPDLAVEIANEVAKRSRVHCFPVSAQRPALARPPRALVPPHVRRSAPPLTRATAPIMRDHDTSSISCTRPPFLVRLDP